jgi:type IV secretion system protein VirB9
VQPSANGFINSMILSLLDGALYQVYAAIRHRHCAPARRTAGRLRSVAAGDTVRWIIGDTESGTGAARQVHILVKPTRAELMTNLVINTDRRTYHMELRSTESTYMASVSWQYPQDQLIALRRQNSAGRGRSRSPTASISPASTSATTCRATARRGGRCAPSTTAGRCSSSFRAASVRARCRRCSSSAPRATRRNWNYRVRGNYMIVDRLFAAAELRFGAGKDQKRVRISRTDGRPAS